MKEKTKLIFDELFNRFPELNSIEAAVLTAFNMIKSVFEQGGKLIVCGNGGSAADSEHIVGELMKKFRKPRPIRKEIYDKLSDYGDNGRILQNYLEGSLRAVSLTSHIALSTAFANDREPSVAYAQQLYGLADGSDVLLAISTSGNSKNCVLAMTVAKAMGLKTIALTGQDESALSDMADITIRVSENETYKVQELHLPVYHCLCAMIEEELFE